MHGWVDSDISAILLALIVIIFVSLAFAHQVISKSIIKLKKNQRIGGATEILVEREQSKAYYKSMLVTNSDCVVCKKPTNRRCSRCKSTRYCSSECQVIHWKEGHKNKCHPPVPRNFCNTSDKSGIMCNSKHWGTSKNVNSTIVLNPICLGFLKSDSYKSNDGDKTPTPSWLAKAPCHALTIDENLSRPKTLLFPYDYFVKLFEWDILSVPCGLINCGNSCFANVVLQCLTYTRPLAAYLLDGCHGDDCKRNDWCFMCELQNHVCKVRQKQIPFSPIRILSRIRNIGNHLGYGRQEDAHEFMRFAIDSMQSICLDEVGGEKAVDAATQKTTLIHHIFGGHLQSQVKCMQCHHESNRYESMMDLAVEIHGVVESLEDAIAQFTTSEMLDGDNKYKCDCCNAYVRAQKRLTIHEAPNILTIALKRFQSGKFGKLNKRVTYPEVLDMSPYMSGNNNEPSLYKLYTVVVHVDMLNASFFGHYICYVKDSNGMWYKIDDNKVKEVDLEKVMIQRAYMLFYSRTTARKTPTIKGNLSATLVASPLASKKDRTSVCMELQRSSIFPPTLGAILVPTDMTRDYLNENEPNCLKIFEKNINDPTQKILQNSKDILEIEYKNVKKRTKDEIPTSKIGSKNELAVEPTSCVGFDSLIDTIPFRASNVASHSQVVNCTLSINNNFGRNGVLLDAISNDLDMQRAKFSHQHLSPLSIPKCLDIDQPKAFPIVDHSNFFPCTHVQDSLETSLSTNGWVGNTEYLDPSNSDSIFPNYTTIFGLSNTFIKKEEQNLNEADSSNNVCIDKAKRQHVENNFERLECADINLNGDFLYMDTDEGNNFTNDGVLNPYKSLKKPSDDVAGSLSVFLDNDIKKGNGRLFQSSNVLHDLESLSFQNTLDTERDELTQSIMKTHGAGIGPIEVSHEGCVLIEEFPDSTLDIRKNISIARVTRSGLEICEEPYELEFMEDDIPYVVVKPLSVEPTIYQFYEEQSLRQPNKVGELVEVSTMEMHDTNMEFANEESVTIGTSNNVNSGIEQSKTTESILDAKPKKQTLKPFFLPGFLSMSPKLTSAKFLNQNNNGVENGRHNERNSHGQGLSIKAKYGLSNGRAATTPVTYDTHMEFEKLITNNKLNNEVEIIVMEPTTNGNHNNEKLVSKKKSKDLLLDCRRDNGSFVFVDQSGKLKPKRGKNNSCTCGSQLKWKNCCGKIIINKGERATKQVKV